MPHRINRYRICKIIASLGILFVFSVARANFTGPLPGFTDAPGEGNCTECHDSFGEIPNQGSGSMSINAPARYEAGERLTITVSVNQAGQRRWGFQLTALSVDNNQPAGQLVVTDLLRTQIVQDVTGRSYIEHTQPGTFPGRPGGATWTFDWVAPETDVGTVAFYATGNAANNDGTREGDWIYSAIATISPPSFPTVQLLSPNGQEILIAGQPVTIWWDAANAESFDILFFPRPGSLPQTIATGLPGDTRSYEWMVPKTATDSATVAVLAFNDVGFGIDESETTFMILSPSPSQLEFLAPVGPRRLKAGATLSIQWAYSEPLSIIRQHLYLSTDGGGSFSTLIASSLPAATRSFDWVVPANLKTPSGRLLVLAELTGGTVIAQMNDENINIMNFLVAPSPSLKTDVMETSLVSDMLKVVDFLSRRR